MPQVPCKEQQRIESRKGGDERKHLPWRRPELVSQPFGDKGAYLVRDRRTGDSFTLGQEEHFLLARLDGTQTADDLCAAFSERFGAPLTGEELEEFFHLARERGLLQPDDTPTPVTPGAKTFHEDLEPLHPAHGPNAGSPQRAAPLRRLAARSLNAVAAVLQWPANLLGAAAGKIRWARFTHFVFVPRPDDIFIVTYPRSGTTWMQMILYQLTTDGSMDFPHIYEYCPWFEKSVRSRMGFENRPSPRLFKSHLRYHQIPKGPCKYIYVARNGKDVAVSYFHHHQSQMGFQGTFAEFFDLFLCGRVEFGSWFQHVKDWWRHRDDPNVLFLHYEDLVGDLEGCLRKIIAFGGFEIAPERFPTILERCSFALMKQYEHQFDPLQGAFWERGIQWNTFLRKGRVGGWKDCLSRAQEERFDTVFHQELGPVGIDFSPRCEEVSVATAP